MSDEPKPTHEHCFVPAKSKVVASDGERVTVVIERCGCGEFRWARVLGEWTLEEINGVTPEPLNDDKFLSDIGVCSQVQS